MAAATVMAAAMAAGTAAAMAAGTVTPTPRPILGPPANIRTPIRTLPRTMPRFASWCPTRRRRRLVRRHRDTANRRRTLVLHAGLADQRDQHLSRACFVDAEWPRSDSGTGDQRQPGPIGHRQLQSALKLILRQHTAGMQSFASRRLCAARQCKYGLIPWRGVAYNGAAAVSLGRKPPLQGRWTCRKKSFSWQA